MNRLFVQITISRVVDTRAQFAEFLGSASDVGDVESVNSYPVATGVSGSTSGGIMLTGAAQEPAPPAPAPAEEKNTKAKKTKTEKDAAAPASPPAEPTTSSGAAAAAAPAPAPSPAAETKPADGAGGAPAAREVSVEMLRAIAAKAIGAHVDNRAKVHAIIKEFSSTPDEPKMSTIPKDKSGAAYDKIEALLPKEDK